MVQAVLTIVSPTPIACTRTRCIVRSSSSPPSSNNPGTPISVSFHTCSPCHKASLTIQRRNMISLGVAGAILGIDLCKESEGKAAARRPPPSPPGEKKDPNVSGVQAKVLASKKRKEAMKESMAKQRERGKPVGQQKPSQVVDQQQPSQAIEEPKPSQVVEQQQPSQVADQQPPSQVVEEQPSQESSQ